MARALHLHCHGALPRRTATALGAFAGNHFIHVGEPDNGCTGSLACHETLDEGFRIQEDFLIPGRPDCHGDCRRFVRKDPAHHQPVDNT